MIIPDINLLVYAYNADSPHHEAAKPWFENAMNSKEETTGFLWAVILGFLRIMTNPKVLVRPMYFGEAIHYTQSWLIRPNTTIINPGPRHLDILRGIMKDIGTAAALMTDAHIAATAIECQGIVYSNDTDFSRFSGLKWVNPLGKGG